MDMSFYGKEELPVQVQPLFDAEPGTMVGPFEEEGALKVSKLIKTGMFPDSLRIRQIVLVAPSATNAALAAVRDSADAIKAQLDKGQSFESLFALHSQKSAGLPADGDMGWLPYGQLPDTLYHLPKGGTLVLQSTQNVFILEVADMKGSTKRAQIATLVKNIEAGTSTVQKIYADASQFAGEHTSAESFAKGAAEKKMNIVNCVRVGSNDQQVNGITDSPRELIRWAFESQKEDVSPIFDLGNVYVVAVLKDIHEKGPMSLSEASYNIKQTLLRQKKAALIGPMMTSAGNDIATIASGLSLPLDTLKGVNFAAYTLPSIGMEYNVLGTAFALKAGSLSKPIEGTSGVYLIYNNEVNEPAQTEDYSAVKTRLGLSFQNRGNYETYDALVKLADVVDGRIKFY
jgi:peptidyl-prolyl cis-trans isomerase D